MKKTTRNIINLRKGITMMALAAASVLTCSGQTTATTDPVGFLYPAGTDLAGQTEPNGATWSNAGPAGPGIKVQAGNLFVPGLDTAFGNHAELAAVSGPAARLAIGSNLNSGSLYYSLAMKVSNISGLGPNGGTILGLNNATGGSQNLPDPLAARLLVRAAGGGYQIGLAKNSSNIGDAVWAPQFLTGTNIMVFLVGSYAFQDGLNNDEARLWINPPAADFDSDSPPPPTLTSLAGDDINEIQSLVLMQQPAPIQPALTLVDEIRVGSSWASVTPTGADYGDAPNSYLTRRSTNGPRHSLYGPILGSKRDRDPDGRPTWAANGDDVLDGVDDEDAVLFPTNMTVGMPVNFYVSSSTGGNVDGWIDFNRNGVFDHPAERILASVAVPAGSTLLSFIVPPTTPIGGTYARFRISNGGGLLPWGGASNGEVEDYGPDAVFFSTNTATGRDLALSLVAPSEATEDGPIHYTLVVSNAGPDVASAIEIVAAQGDVPLASLQGTSSQGPVQVEGSEVHCFVASLPPGQTAFFDIFTEVSATLAGDADLNFAAWASSDVPDVFPADNVVSGSIRRRSRDWGDAPAGYPVTASENGAYHRLGSNWKLGATWDAETNGTHSVNADYDDTHGGTPDDEDGVLVTGATGTISVKVVAARDGYLDAWMDFQRNTNWSDAGEQIFASKFLTAGTNSLSVTVPGYATTGDFVSRWRFSQSGGFAYTGFGGVGEVEDHIISWQSEGGNLDFGDAPNSFHTLLTNDGPRHTIVSGWVLGTHVDYETDGQPSPGALLDDNTSTSGPDDEDGIKFMSPLVRGGTATVQVVAYPAGKLDAWIDFNGNGQFDHLSPDRIFTNRPVGPGTNMLTFTVPPGSSLGATFARFRFSSAGNLLPTGAAPDGEVEDYRVIISQVDTNTPATADYGDAPDSYSTLAASGGPSHIVSTDWQLGTAPDAEYDGFPTGDADGDDVAGTDDEDSVAFYGALIPGSTNYISFSNLKIPSGETGYFNGWLDYGRDGNFTATNDHILVDLMIPPASSGFYFAGYIPILIPATAVPGETYARFRLSSASGISFGGSDARGEVEDLKVMIEAAGFTSWASVRAQLIGVPAQVEEGDPIAYSIVVSNTGPTTATGVQLVGALPALMTIESISSSKGNATLEGSSVLCAIGSLAPAESVTVQVTFGTDALITDDVAAEIEEAVQSWALTLLEADTDPLDNVVVAVSGVRAKRDFGDAPNSFRTVLSTNGPRHGIRPGWRMGATIDANLNGLPGPNADGDDLSGIDDEDGVQFIAPFISSLTTTVRVDVVCPVGTNGYINAWFDLDHDNTFAATNEHLIVDAVVTPGVNDLSFVVPATAAAGSTYARFRLSAAPGLSYQGWSPQGEVEDYFSGQPGAENLRILTLDYGDAPDSYHTTLTNDGPRHVVRSQLYLGARADEEVDGIPSTAADGDDNDMPYGTDDEEGLVIPPHLEPGFAGHFVVSCTVTTGLPAYVDGWVDYNTNGIFDHPDELLCAGALVVVGTNVIPYSVPPDALPGPTYLRLRISSTGGLSPVGFASDGEVEDYAIAIGGTSPPPTLTSSYSSGQLTLTWDTGQAVLESTETVNGPWLTLSNAVSPLVFTPDKPKEFFRVKRTNP